MNRMVLLPALFLLAISAASCGGASAGDSAVDAAADPPFTASEQAGLDEPWAAAFMPGTALLVVTTRPGVIRAFDTASDGEIAVSGAPKVDYGGQGGLGDIAFAPDFATSRAVYLSWAEAGPNNTRGAVVGKGQMDCDDSKACAIRDLTVIWRQAPKVTGRGHYSHRLLFSPDGQFLYVSSGDRQKMAPAQDPKGNLGKVVRLSPDGTPAAGNPLAEEQAALPEIWTMGHRNVLGLAFDGQGRLWELEHGPAGGDELNLLRGGANYGWPVVSEGVHYNGTPIPDHSTRPEFEAPRLSWTPVIAPGGMIYIKGNRYPGWQGKLLITGLASEALVLVDIGGDRPVEAARYDMRRGMRAVVEGPDGTVWVLENGRRARLLKLEPR